MSDIRDAVRETYGKIGAAQNGATGCCGSGGCSSEPTSPSVAQTSRKLGYSQAEVQGAPEGSNLGLGCGNPQAIAALKLGETVLDLGSGGGFDCFLAAKQVGKAGRVIGVDMTPEMISRARANAQKARTKNVEFRLGEIEHLPVADGSVDAIISNCVINLSPDKPAVYREAFRVLKPGGRLAISDVVTSALLPEAVRQDVALHTGCVAGASLIAELESLLAELGFENVRVRPKDESREFIREWSEAHNLKDVIVSANIEATKPR